MKRRLLISCTLITTMFSARAQSFDWAQSFKGSGEAVIRDIATDASGNIYVFGDFNGSIDIDPTTNDSMVLANGATDLFFAKADSNGAVQWIKTMGGVNNEAARGIAVDNNGNVILCGAFTTTMNFNPGGNPTNLAFLGVADGFVAKYDNNGSLLWVRQQGGTAEIYTNGVACDADGNVFITGYYFGTMSPDHGITMISHISQGQKDIFLTKFDSTGAFKWSRSVGGTSFDGGVAIAIDTNGDPVITGYYQGVVDFDPGVGTVNDTANGGSDIFTCKFNTLGGYTWLNSGFFNGMYTDEPTSVHIGGDNKVYVTGYTNMQALGLLMRLSETGQDEKFVALYHPTFAPGNNCIIYDVKTDADENFYICGAINGSIDMNADTASTQVNLVTSNAADMFVGKYDTSGAQVFMKYSSTSDAQVNYALALDPLGGIYLAGTFYDTIDCDYEATNALIAADLGADAHLHRLRQAAPVSVVSAAPLPTELLLYPNPAGNTLYLQGIEAGSNASIYSSDGRLVKQVRTIPGGAIDITALPAGLYFIRANAATGRFLKQ
ncbi:MAG: T9SS type A sorting domain-containing protein [Flavipsychrobacter sp.]|nr:T9SS type A sorting domain-containing protein [Flavipsychrobacter sp.]